MSDRIRGPASMPTLENPFQRPSPWACKPGAGYWWQDVIDRLLLGNDARTLVHVWFDGASIKDSYNNPWTMVGTVPQVPGFPNGAGPFSDANYYQLGSGVDAMDPTGDWSAAIVFGGLPLGSFANAPYLADDGSTGGPASGWAANTDASARFGYYSYADAANVFSPNSIIDAVVNIACFGRGGTTGYAKLNLGAIATLSQPAFNMTVPRPTRIGRGSVVGQSGRPWPGKIYEVWFSGTPPSDALFTSMAQRVKNKLGITAW